MILAGMSHLARQGHDSEGLARTFIGRILAPHPAKRDSLARKMLYDDVVAHQYLFNQPPSDLGSYQKAIHGAFLIDAAAEHGHFLPLSHAALLGALQDFRIDLANPLHRNFVEYACLTLALQKPTAEAYDALQQNLDGPLFYRLLPGLIALDPQRAQQHIANTHVIAQGHLACYETRIPEQPFDLAPPTKVFMCDYLENRLP